MNQTIEIIISTRGETTVQTKGFVGSSCRDATKALEQALGAVQSDKPTTEMYQNQTVDPVLLQGNG